MSRFPLRIPGKVSIEGLQSELSNLVERWWHCGVNTGPLDGQDWAPPVEIVEDADCYRVTMEIAGVSRPSIDVTAVGTTLQVTGDKLAAAASEQTSAAKTLYSERRYGGFKRLINLPGPMRISEVTAVLVDGVLTVTLPKATGTGPQDVRIPIRTPEETPPSA
jgi:HSP20 family protein